MRRPFWILIALLMASASEAQVRCDAADLATRLLGARRMVLADPADLPLAQRAITATLAGWSGTIRKQRDGPTDRRDAEAIVALAALARQAANLAEQNPDAARQLLTSPRADALSHLSTLAVLRAACDVKGTAEDAPAATMGLRDGAMSGSGVADLGTTWEGKSTITLRERAPQGLIALLVLLAAGVGLQRYRSYRSQQTKRRKRYAMALPVSYQLAGLVLSGRIIDINCFGLKLQHDGALHKDAVTRVGLMDEWREVRIVWSNSHYAGGVFTRPFSLPALLLLVASHHSFGPGDPPDEAPA